MAEKKKAAPKKKLSLPTKLPSGYGDVLDSTVQKIQSAQGRAMSAVNKELIDVYRDIGKTMDGATLSSKLLPRTYKRSSQVSRGFRVVTYT